MDLNLIKIFVEKEVSCYVIDTFDEHLNLILSVEKGLEEMKGSNIPFRSEFEEFIPYVHINENFKYLDFSTEDAVISVPTRKEVLLMEKEKRKNEKRREKMREEIRDQIQDRYYKLLEKAQLVYEYENCKYRLSKTVGAVDLCPAAAVQGTALDCLRNIVFLREYVGGSCLSESSNSI